MAERTDPSSSMISPEGGTKRARATGMSEKGGGSVAAEFVDAARSAAESLLEEQKRQIADRVAGIAEALRGAAKPLDQSQNHIIARYLDTAAGQVESASREMRYRRWSELVADAEDFARRKPTLFVLSAVAVGFVMGRLLWTSTAGRQHEARRSFGGAEPARSVTAAVASATGAATGEPTGNAGARAGAAEAR